MALHSGHLQTSGQYRLALQVSKQAIGIAREIEHHQWIILASFQLGYVYLDLFLPDQALSTLEPAFALAQSLQSAYWMRICAALLAEAHILKTDYDAAKRTLDAVLEDAAPARTVSERMAWLVRTHLFLASGDPDGAMRCLDHLVEDAQDLGEEGEYDIAGVSLLRGTVITELIRSGKAHSQAGRAETALQKAKKLAEHWPKYPLLWRVHGSLGRLYSVLGREEEAQREFGAAQTIIDRLAEELPEELREGFLRGATDYLYAQGEQHA